jgi:hypothetical protein
MKKLFISFVVIFLLLTQLASAQMFGGAGFSDVNEGTDYYDSIKWMAENEIVGGYADGTFRPDDCVNRVEFLRMMYATLEVDLATRAVALFSDTPEGQWYSSYVRKARATGAVSGYPDGTFRPEQCVNRAEAVKMAVLAFNDNVLPETSFPAVEYSDIIEGQWYYDYFNYAFYAYLLGEKHTTIISSGGFEYYGEKFYPGDSMTRKEVAEMLYRMKVVKDNSLAYNYSWQEPYPIGYEPFYLACSLDGQGIASDVSIENLLPADIDLAFGVDYTDEDQIANLKAFMELFSSSEVDSLVASYDESVAADRSYETAVKPVVDSKWELLYGMNFIVPDESVDFNSMEAYVAFKVEESDLFAELAGSMLSEQFRGDISCKDDGDFVYWTSESDDFYMVRYGDVFFVSNFEALRDEFVVNIDSGNSGFARNSVPELAYFYLNIKKVLDGDFGMENYADFINLDLSFQAIEDGLKISTETELALDRQYYTDDYFNYDVHLVDNVPASGLIAYVEGPGMDFLGEVNRDFYYFDYSMDYENNLNFYSYLIKDKFLASDLLSAEDYALLKDSPFSVAVYEGDDGDKNNKVSFYIELDDSKAVLGNVLTDAVDSYIDSMIADNGVQFVDGQNINDFVHRDTAFAYGSGLKKVYVNLKGIGTGDSTGSADLEIYYGMLDDNVFTVSMYPSFEKDYGVNTLANSAKYLEAVDKLAGVYGNAVAYVDMDVLADVLALNVLDITDEFESAVVDFVKKMDYFVGSLKKDGDLMKSDMYLIKK